MEVYEQTLNIKIKIVIPAKEYSVDKKFWKDEPFFTYYPELRYDKITEFLDLGYYKKHKYPALSSFATFNNKVIAARLAGDLKHFLDVATDEKFDIYRIGSEPLVFCLQQTTIAYKKWIEENNINV